MPDVAEAHPNYGPIAGLARPMPASGYLPPVSQHEEIAARQLAGLLDAGDEGTARHLVHQLEHGLAAWTISSPWRLLDALCAEARRAAISLPPSRRRWPPSLSRQERRTEIQGRTRPDAATRPPAYPAP